MIRPISFYSKPLRKYHTKLAQVFEMPIRVKAGIPNRTLVVAWNASIPLPSHFVNNYSYYQTFSKKHAAAGNHYHKIKEEIMHPIHGNFTVLLEDINTKEKETIELSSSKHNVLYVPTYIAHTVIAKEDNAILLVTANNPSAEEDEIAYIIN